MNRENLCWEKLLTDLQYRDFGPYAHEDEPLVEAIYKILKHEKGMHVTVKQKDLRSQRSAIQISKPVDRLQKRKNKFRGLVDMATTDTILEDTPA